MIYRIVGVSMLFFCLIALGLSFSGIEHVDVGIPFIAFLNNCSRQLSVVKISIPDIPPIPRWELEESHPTELFTFLASIVNALVFIGNMFVTTLNIISEFINTIIHLYQFIIIIFNNLNYFKDSLHPTPSPSIPIPVV